MLYIPLSFASGTMKFLIVVNFYQFEAEILAHIHTEERVRVRVLYELYIKFKGYDF